MIIKKEASITVRMTSEEYDKVKKASNIYNISKAEYIRRLINGGYTDDNR